MRGRDAHFRHDGTHRDQVAAIDALLGVQHRVAHHIGFDVMHEAGIDIRGHLAFTFTDKLGRELLFRGAERVAALELDRQLESSREVGGGCCLQLCPDRRMHVFRHGARLLRRFFRQADDGVNRGLHLLVAEHHRAQHHGFGQFLGFGFHHHHGVMGAGDDQIELGIRHVVDRRVEAVFAIDVTHAGRTDRAHEGQAGNGESGGNRNHRHDDRDHSSRSWE